ncbi:MAG: hypothetical protein J7K64_05770 [Bacteroidales bacterium]|nr:hypothetical protein [Bacteroidales bacterium]
MFKILIAEPTHEILQKRLSEAGFFCSYEPKLTFSELQKKIPDYNGLVIRSKFKIDSNFIKQAVNLKFIARAGAGMENIDTVYAESKGIKCLNSPEGNKDSVGEHTLGMLLTLMHKIKISDAEIRKGIWNRQNIGTEIQGKTIGIIGYGNMGSAFAQRLKGFSVNVIAYDKYKTDFSDDYVKEVNLESLFQETVILSVHVPLTEETQFMINDDFINHFKNPIYLINTARGKIVKTDDLVKNMKSEKIIGACLDVSEYEKTSFEDIFAGQNSPALQYLTNSDKVILTPHIAGSSKASYRKIADVLAKKIINLSSI